MGRVLFVMFSVVAVANGCGSNSNSNGATGAGGEGGSTGGGGSTGSTSGGKVMSCPTSSNSNCKQSDIDTYSNCVLDKCDGVYKMCLGSGYRNGSFSGPCGTYVTCTSKCGCNNTSCTQACGQPSQECVSCLQGFTTCASMCQVPACYTGGSTGAGGSGGSGGAGGTGTATCADLKKCCDAMTDNNAKAACNAGVSSNNQQACSLYLMQFKAAGLCK